jgi:protein tyrosine phosphatase
LIAKIDPPAADKAVKQILALEMLQNKFSGTKSTNEEIKDLIIAFINNLQSKKINAVETKLWKRVNEAIKNLADQLP